MLGWIKLVLYRLDRWIRLLIFGDVVLDILECDRQSDLEAQPEEEMDFGDLKANQAECNDGILNRGGPRKALPERYNMPEKSQG